jgi:hypothetical protein
VPSASVAAAPVRRWARSSAAAGLCLVWSVQSSPSEASGRSPCAAASAPARPAGPAQIQRSVGASRVGATQRPSPDCSSCGRASAAPGALQAETSRTGAPRAHGAEAARTAEARLACRPPRRPARRAGAVPPGVVESPLLRARRAAASVEAQRGQPVQRWAPASRDAGQRSRPAVHPGSASSRRESLASQSAGARWRPAASLREPAGPLEGAGPPPWEARSPGAARCPRSREQRGARPGSAIAGCRGGTADPSRRGWRSASGRPPPARSGRATRVAGRARTPAKASRTDQAYDAGRG